MREKARGICYQILFVIVGNVMLWSFIISVADDVPRKYRLVAGITFVAISAILILYTLLTTKNRRYCVDCEKHLPNDKDIHTAWMSRQPGSCGVLCDECGAKANLQPFRCSGGHLVRFK